METEMPARRITHMVDEKTAGWTIRQFLARELSFTPRQISRLKFSRSGITVNGERSYVTRVLREGDLLEIPLTMKKDLRDTEGARPPKIWDAPTADPEKYPLQILYEDEDLLVVNKPSGIVCHPSPGHYSDTLANQAADHLGAVGTAADIRVTGRLDRETSGIVVFARNAEAAASLQRQRLSGSLVKEYLALVSGIVSPGEGVIDLPLRREYPGSHRMTAAADGKPAVTNYRVIRVIRGNRELQGISEKDFDTSGDASLLQCTIEHGRTHQIRVHLACSGHPILGDLLYGRNETAGEAEKSAAPGDQICLHAHRICFRQPFSGEEIRITAPLPGWAAGPKG